MTFQQAEDLITEMAYGQTDTVTLGLRIGLSLDAANSDGFRRLVESLWSELDKTEAPWDR